MPLTVLVAMVTIGVSLVVLAVHVSGGTRVARLHSADDARTRFAVDHPDAEMGRCLLSADGRDAVIELADGTIGFVHAVGSKFLTRHALRGEIRGSTGHDDPAKLVLATGDFTWPRATVSFESAAEASEAAALIAGNTAEVAGQERAA